VANEYRISITVDGRNDASGAFDSINFGLDGLLYCGGDFTSIGVVAASRVAKWNGSSWTPLGSGLNGACHVLYCAPDGRIWAGGEFTTAGGLSTPGYAASWNGSNWLPLDIALATATAPIVNTIVATRTGILTFGFLQTTTGTATATAITSVTNNGKVTTYPRLIINGPSSGTATIYAVTNRTTGDSIYFSSALVLNTGEKFTLDFTPGAKSFKSSFQGNIIGRIVRGSNTGRFRLRPGTNSIGFYSSSSSVTASLIWPERHWSVDGKAS